MGGWPGWRSAAHPGAMPEFPGAVRRRWARAGPFPSWLALAPDVARCLHDEAELCGLLFLGQDVAFHGGGEAALRREAELVERDELGGLVDAALQRVGALQLTALGRHQA